ncbi:hypothetical protein EMCRGX_G010476 [Ephydatia muelleri]
MGDDIRSFVQICDTCQRSNDAKFVKTDASLHPIPIKSRVWDQVGIDLVGPLPKTAAGNRYIVTLMDYFSKWPEAEPLKDKSAHGVASFLFRIICRKAILPIENEICPHDSDEAFEGQTEVVIKSMYDVQKNMLSIAKSNISKAQCRYKSDYDKKHCKGKAREFKYRQLDGSVKPVSYASRSLTPTEQKYALGVTWACERFRDFLTGLQFQIEMDHKPLVPLLGLKNLEDLPLRVQRFRLRLTRFKHGIPNEVVSDNGPQFSSNVFHSFAGENGFVHTTSSPRYPQGNGEVEWAVRTIKNILDKAKDPYLGLLAYRSTPLRNGYSPSGILMNRRLRTTVPTLGYNLHPSVPNYAQLRAMEQKDKQKQ